MGSLSNFAEDELLDHVLGTGAYSRPTIYVGLSTADPLDDASGNAEPGGGSYVREAHASWDVAATRLTANNGACTFTTATGAWGDLTHWALWDAETAGNMLAHGALAALKAVVDGNTPSIADGEMTVTFSASGAGGGWTDVLVHEMLDHLFTAGTYAAPTIYWALSTTTPTDDGPNVTEPSGNGYAREAHSAYDVSSGGASENTGVLTFDTPSGSWGLCTHAAMFDALTVGNCLMWANVEDNTIGTDDTVSFAAGALDLTLD